MKLVFCILLFVLVGCATTSVVMEVEGGAYMISAHASTARGGAAGASDLAYKKAMEFCAAQGKRAVAVSSEERDVYQSAGGGSFNQSGGGFGGGKFASGNVNLVFKCL
jgi:hypothetical protein